MYPKFLSLLPSPAENIYYLFRERAWIGTYTTVELIYAQKLGYRVLELFEAYTFRKKEKIFAKFMQLLAHFKLKVRYAKYAHADIFKCKLESFSIPILIVITLTR